MITKKFMIIISFKLYLSYHLTVDVLFFTSFLLRGAGLGGTGGGVLYPFLLVAAGMDVVDRNFGLVSVSYSGDDVRADGVTGLLTDSLLVAFNEFFAE